MQKQKWMKIGILGQLGILSVNDQLDSLESIKKGNSPFPFGKSAAPLARFLHPFLNLY